MTDWWLDNGPPTYVAAAGYLGLIKKRRKKKNGKVETGDLSELLKLAGPGGIL